MKPYEEVIPGTKVKFEMLPLPGGTIHMGSPPEDAQASPDELPQHLVTIQPFWMEKTETTWDEYDLFAFSNDILKKKREGVNLAQQQESEQQADAITRPTAPYTDETFGFGREGHPVINITHHAAMEYARWLSTKTGKTYRLPTEAEWEYACHAGSDSLLGAGIDLNNLGDYAWYRENSQAMPHPIAKKKPNAWGLDDLLGNVAEWCLDLYDKDFYKSFKPLLPVVEPALIPGAQKYPHVARGGSYDDTSAHLRCAARLASNPDWSQQDPQRPQSIWWHTDALTAGFRVVRPLEEQENLKGVRSQVKRND